MQFTLWSRQLAGCGAEEPNREMAHRTSTTLEIVQFAATQFNLINRCVSESVCFRCGFALAAKLLRQTDDVAGEGAIESFQRAKQFAYFWQTQHAIAPH